MTPPLSHQTVGRLPGGKLVSSDELSFIKYQLRERERARERNKQRGRNLDGVVLEERVIEGWLEREVHTVYDISIWALHIVLGIQTLISVLLNTRMERNSSAVNELF